MFRTNKKKFYGLKSCWLTRDNKEGYDQEIMFWVSTKPPTIDPASKLYSYRHHTQADYEFTVMDIDIFETIYGLKLNPGQIIKVGFKGVILA